jgi:tetratricopeptide (TPR) repeat protein
MTCVSSAPLRTTALVWALGAALGAVAWGAPAKITTIDVTGNTTVGTATILDAIKGVAVVGQEIASPYALFEPIRQALLKLGYFDDVAVTATPAQGGYALTIKVTEHRRVAGVVFRGNQRLSAEQLKAVITTRPGFFANQQIIARDVSRIEDAYRQAGLSARVTGADLAADGTLTFTIRETYLEAVRIRGLHTVGIGDLQGRISLQAGDPVDEKAISADIAKLQQTGWFADVEVDVNPGQKDPANAVIVDFLVRERPGVFPDRVGAPVAGIVPAKLREDITSPKLDIQYSAEIRTNDFLLDAPDGVAAALQRLDAATRNVDPTQADRTQALALFDHALALDAVQRPEEAKKRFGDAAIALQRLLDKAPTDVVLLTKLGACRSRLGQHEAALQLLRRAVEIAPQKWEPRVALAQADSSYVLGQFGDWMAKELRAGPTPTPEAVAQSPVLRAVIEAVPLERTRKLLLDLIKPAPSPEELLRAGQEVPTSLEAAFHAAPQEPAVARAYLEGLMGSAFAIIWGLGSHPEQVWPLFQEETAQLLGRMGDLRDKDPGVALVSAFAESINAVLMLAGRPTGGPSEEELNAQLRALAKRLTEISERWPVVLRTSGSLLGILQFLAGQDDLAKATFEQAIAQNPYERQNYNALMGLAFKAEDYAEFERIVRRRMAVAPSVEDYILLGKIAERTGRPQEALEHFREAIRQFPQEAIGYAATAGWLLHLGTDDAEAERLLNRALALNPQSAYAQALHSALLLLQGKGEEAREALRQALAISPQDELANTLRDEYFAATDA